MTFLWNTCGPLDNCTVPRANLSETHPWKCCAFFQKNLVIWHTVSISWSRQVKVWSDSINLKVIVYLNKNTCFSRLLFKINFSKMSLITVQREGLKFYKSWVEWNLPMCCYFKTFWTVRYWTHHSTGNLLIMILSC